MDGSTVEPRPDPWEESASAAKRARGYAARMAKKTASKADNSGLTAAMRVVVLKGKETYERDRLTRELDRVLREAHGSIERFEFDGERADLATVLDELRTYGLMQTHKLVILNSADAFLAGSKDEEKDPDSRNRRAIEAYVENPVAEATLLMRAGGWRPGRIDKLIDKIGGAVISCEALNDDQAAHWLISRAAAHDVKIQPEAAAGLVERLGSGMGALDSELFKLATYAGPGGTITPELVGELVGKSRQEVAWEVQNAVVLGGAGGALERVGELIDVSKNDVVPMMWSVCDLARKMHAAARLAATGTPPGVVMKQVKLWGSMAGPTVEAARKLGPARTARMFHAAVETDYNSKRGGLGDARRNLEGLVVRVADTIQRVR